MLILWIYLNGDIYNLYQGQNGNSMCRLFGRWEYIWTLAMMININFGATDLLLRNWGGMCWHRFLTRFKEGDSCEGKVADLEETKRCTGLESTDRVRLIDQGNMLWRCWFTRICAQPMESCRWSQGTRRGSGLYENLDDSVVVLSSLYLVSFFFRLK